LYTNWMNDDPNDNGGVEDCLALVFGASPEWIDYDCALVAQVVCESY
jgi:hypothetical protein